MTYLNTGIYIDTDSGDFQVLLTIEAEAPFEEILEIHEVRKWDGSAYVPISIDSWDLDHYRDDIRIAFEHRDAYWDDAPPRWAESPGW